MPEPMLTVKNWDKFQHYKDRNPPWIKLYTDTFHRRDFNRLPDDSKLLALCIWTLAAREASCAKGSIPLDLDWIKSQCGLGPTVTKSSLQVLVSQGFVLCDSEMLASCKQDAIPEERRGEREVETDVAAPPPVTEKESPKPDPNCEAILKAWDRAVAIRTDWIPQPKMPGNKDTRNLLKLRASEPDFIGMLDRYVELVTALDWAEAKQIVFFLRRQTFDNCLSGEFAPSQKKANAYRPKAETAPQADPDVEMKKQRQADRLREIANASKSAGTNLF